jgi:hypothetical protein
MNLGNICCGDTVTTGVGSRLLFRCCHCGATGSRNESFHAQPGCVPGFMDKCPTCHSTDVEVMDPAVYGAEALS